MKTSSTPPRRLRPTALAAAVLLGGTVPAFALDSTSLPTGLQVTAGTASVQHSGHTLTVQQGSASASLNWQRFDIGRDATVRFEQPSASAIAVNRVLGSDASQIFGRLQSNGQVALINPNGVLFGASAQVDVGGLVASTLATAASSPGTLKLQGSSGASVVNQGTLNGNTIALVGRQVENTGTITARLGSVALAAGQAATLTFDGARLVSLAVDQGAVDALVHNGGAIRADGGRVLLTAQAADALTTAAVNHDGIVEARTIGAHTGRIELLADMARGHVQVAGTLDAGAPEGGNGGFIETSAAHVHIADTARIGTAAPQGRAGTWLVDPQDFVIAASGGDIGGSALGAQLAGGNVVITSAAGANAGNGDVRVDDAVSWAADTTLTLNATRHIAINANLSASGLHAGLVLTPGGNGSVQLASGKQITLSGANASLTMAGQAYTLIHDVNALQNMASNLSGFYALASDIDASATATWNGGAGFAPVGATFPAAFTGTLDGLGHTVDRLTINRPATQGVGLFGWLGGSSRVQHIALTNANVIGFVYAGSLAGVNQTGTIDDASAGGSVSATQGTRIGGLVGENRAGAVISHSRAAVNVTMNNFGDTFGGLVGSNTGTILASQASGTITGGINGSNYLGGLSGDVGAGGRIVDSQASGTVNGTSGVGGLVGYVSSGSVVNSSASGAVNGTFRWAGGLVGMVDNGNISDSHASGNVTVNNASAYGTAGVGGLIGTANNGSGSLITRNYATGNVSVHGPGADVGGLVGDTSSALTVISNSYATGHVQAFDSGAAVGGLIGRLTGTLSDSYALGNVTAATGATAGGVAGTVASGAAIARTYAVGSVSGDSASGRGGLVGNLAGSLSNSVWNSAAAAAAFGTGAGSATGNLALSLSAMQQAGSYAGLGWSLASAGGSTATWRIYDGQTLPLLRSLLTPLTITADNAVATYDGTAHAGGGSVSYSIAPPDFSKLLGTLTVGSASATHAGTYTVTPGGLYSVQTGYDISWVGGGLTINPAALTVSTTAVTRPYDGTLDAAGSLVLVSGQLYGGASLGGGSFAFTDMHAGSGKTVNVSGATVQGGTAADYVLSYVPNTTSVITPKTITVGAVTVSDKTYDTTTAATLGSVTLAGVLGGDSVAASGTAAFADSHAGTGKAVSISGLTLGGSSAGDYALATTTASTTANIAQAALRVTANDDGKVADGVPYAGGRGVVFGGFVGGETAAVLGGALVYGGSSQGATLAGQYAITPGGYGSVDYRLVYVDGTLTISPAVVTPPTTTPPTTTPPTTTPPSPSTSLPPDVRVAMQQRAECAWVPPGNAPTPSWCQGLHGTAAELRGDAPATVRARQAAQIDNQGLRLPEGIVGAKP